MTDSISQLINLFINDRGVCRTAPATPGLLKTDNLNDTAYMYCTLPPALPHPVPWAVCLGFWGSNYLLSTTGGAQK